MINKLVKITFPILFIPFILLSPCYAQNQGSISITQKMIDVSIINRQRENTYQIFLFDSNGQHINASLEDGLFESGDKVKLKNNSSVKIIDIPIGTNFRILQTKPFSGFEDRERVFEGKITEQNKDNSIFIRDTETDNFVYVFPEVYTIIGNSMEMSKEVAYKIEALDELPKDCEIPLNPIYFKGSGPNVFPGLKFYNGIEKLRLQITPIDLKDSYVYEKERTIVHISNGGAEWFQPKIQYEKNNKLTENPPVYRVNKISPISFSPRVSKRVEGKYPFNNSFRIQLEDVPDFSTGMILPIDRDLEILPNTEGVFNPIKFTKTGIFQFKIREKQEFLPGIDYDPTIFTETVTVGMRDSDLLITDINLKQDELEVFNEKALFINKYHSGDLKIEKHVTGKTSEESFQFKVRFYNESEEEVSRYPCIGNNIESIQSGETFLLKDGESLKIQNLPEGLKYSIQELDLPKGYNSEIENGDGVIRENEEIIVNCRNTYKPEKATYTPSIIKEIDGDQPDTEQEFTFIIESEESQETLPENTEAHLNGIGQTSFETLTFENPGTYHYTIREREEEIPGYHFDDSVWNLNIEVVDIEAVLTIKSAEYSNSQRSETESAVFTNIFTLNPTTLILPVEKEFRGKEPEYIRNYQFYIEKDPQNPEGDTIENQLMEYNLDNPESQSFKPITFKKPGIFNYTIREIETKETGITYDKSVFKVTANVSQTGAELSVDHDITKEEETVEKLHFINTYEVSDVTFNKVISGYSIPDLEYTFKFTFRNPEKDEYLYPISYTKDSSSSILNSGGILKLKENETLVFKDLPQGLEYSVQELEIPPSYRAEEEIKSGIIGRDNHLVFTNIYQAQSVEVSPSVTKQIQGDYSAVDKTFKFLLEPVGEPTNDPVGEKKELNISGAGTQTFEALNYTVPGTFEYTLSEEDSGYTGYSFDKRRYNYKVEVIDTGGKLQANETISLSGEDKDLILFTNRYKPLSASYAPKVYKEVIGKPVNESEFRFILSQVQKNTGAVLPENTELLISGTGTKSFDEIIFNHSGDYLFEITEISGKEPGYEYDPSVFRLAVSIVDRDGRLAVSKAEYKRVENNETDLVRNYYKEPTVLSALPKLEIKTLGPEKLKAIENNEEVSEFHTNLLNKRPLFKNTFRSGDLEITKNVVDIETKEPFKIKVTLTDKDHRVLNQNFNYSGFTDNVFKNPGYIEIHDQETIKISSIPIDTNYEIEEEQTSDFKCEIKNGQGIIQDKNTSRCEITNIPVEISKSEKNKNYDLPKTGRKNNYKFLKILGVLISISIILLILRHFNIVSFKDIKKIIVRFQKKK